MDAKLCGSYVLLMRLGESRDIETGRLGGVHFIKGYYAYAGSAVRGIKARVGRHLREDKKRHWHIDYLLERAEIIGIFVGDKPECSIAGHLESRFDLIKGFGSSDCRCRSHLFFCPDEDELRTGINGAIEMVVKD